jgi:glyoxylase-like metal-dependent hydrolase (beta-lactamase superfamily II)
MDGLPGWATLVRAPNPGPMTLDGTNTWLIRLPTGGRVAVDPGPLYDEHLRAVAAGGPLAGVLITHRHPDHVEGLDRLLEITDAGLLTEAPGVTPIATPGHTADSVSFLVDIDGERGVLTGDTILGRGSTVVAYPDGDLGEYLDSLTTLEGLGRIAVLPGHGPVLPDCAAAARDYLDHREARLEQVRAALRDGARTPREVVETVYRDVDPVLWPAAELSVRAQLAFLESSGANVRWDTP